MKDSVNKYLVINTDGEHEYTIHVKTTNKGVKYTLFRSENKCWTSTARGKKLLSITNTGNEIILDREIKVMDYEQLAELRLLLRFENKIDTKMNWDEYKILPEENVIKIKN